MHSNILLPTIFVIILLIVEQYEAANKPIPKDKIDRSKGKNAVSREHTKGLSESLCSDRKTCAQGEKYYKSFIKTLQRKSPERARLFEGTINSLSKSLKLTERGRDFIKKYNLSQANPVESFFAKQTFGINLKCTPKGCKCPLENDICPYGLECPALPEEEEVCAWAPECGPGCKLITLPGDNVNNSKAIVRQIMKMGKPKSLSDEMVQVLGVENNKLVKVVGLAALKLEGLEPKCKATDSHGKCIRINASRRQAGLLGAATGLLGAVSPIISSIGGAGVTGALGVATAGVSSGLGLVSQIGSSLVNTAPSMVTSVGQRFDEHYNRGERKVIRAETKEESDKARKERISESDKARAERKEEARLAREERAEQARQAREEAKLAREDAKLAREQQLAFQVHQLNLQHPSPKPAPKQDTKMSKKPSRKVAIEANDDDDNEQAPAMDNTGEDNATDQDDNENEDESVQKAPTKVTQIEPTFESSEVNPAIVLSMRESLSELLEKLKTFVISIACPCSKEVCEQNREVWRCSGTCRNNPHCDSYKCECPFSKPAQAPSTPKPKATSSPTTPSQAPKPSIPTTTAPKPATTTTQVASAPALAATSTSTTKPKPKVP